MVVDSELVRRVEQKLESLPIKGFETVLHVLVVIAALKERNAQKLSGKKHLSLVHTNSVQEIAKRVGVENLFIPRDEKKIVALAPITVRSDRKGGRKL